MPALFIGHGNPMNAIEDNAWSRAWKQLASTLPKPRAVLSVSAHWYAPGSRVTANLEPRTIHDFGGFPKALFEVQYPAPGSPELAQRVRELLAPKPVEMDPRWGLDHGTWSVLVHLLPHADVPVVQLSIDETLNGLQHYRLAQALRPLRDEGVLILGSGNLVHNLHAYAWGREAMEPYDWGLRFEAQARALIEARRFPELAAYEDLGRDAALSAPTPEHFLPLVYVMAQFQDGDETAFPVEGFDGGSVSMLALRVG